MSFNTFLIQLVSVLVLTIVNGLSGQDDAKKTSLFESESDAKGWAYSTGYLSGQEFKRISQRINLHEKDLRTEDVIAGFKDAISSKRSRVGDIEGRRIRFDSVFTFARRAKLLQDKFLAEFSDKPNTAREPTGAFWRQVKVGQGKVAAEKDVLEVLITQQGMNSRPESQPAMMSVRRVSQFAPRLVKAGILKRDAKIEIVTPMNLGKYLRKFILEEANPPLIFKIEIKAIHASQDLADFDMTAAEEELAYERLGGIHDLQAEITSEFENSIRNKAHDFLRQNRKKKDVVQLDNGSQFKILVPGNGRSAKWGDQVAVRFRILDQDQAVVFDSRTLGRPAILPVWKQVAWAKGICKMKKGAKCRFYFPPGQGMTQNNNDVEIVDIELVDFIDKFDFPEPKRRFEGVEDSKGESSGGGSSNGGSSEGGASKGR